MQPYFTLFIPWVPSYFATEWHPTENTGPFKVLTRGCFPDIGRAIAWGAKHLGGCPYTVKLVDAQGNVHDADTTVIKASDQWHAQ